MKVIVSADGGAEGRAARRWCVEHLTPKDQVVAVLGVDSLSEAMLSVSPFLAVADPDTLREGVERRFRRRPRAARRALPGASQSPVASSGGPRGGAGRARRRHRRRQTPPRCRR